MCRIVRRSPAVWAWILLAAAASCKEPTPGQIPGNGPRSGVSEAEPLDPAKIAAGQTLYVPAYSHVLTANDARPFNLALTLSIRNTDRTHPILLTGINYFDRDGKQVRQYLKKPQRLAPMASAEIFVKEKDTSAGSSASFLVDWVAERKVSDPISEVVMIGTASTQGISFTCTGRVIADRSRP
ncbi:DUF3124 domain-containing protein [Singulisphaera sp. PoT]|uniref:DUF3124 domain-containing protein n=1 Tax=Singulisphaera sp. PoT TaxID=3411797 RepID=UPI003BF4CEC0